MRVLIACEYSGAVRDAFIAKGHDAISCDLLPTDSPGPHYHGDVFDIIGDGWDLIIAHPPCTFLTGAAAWALKDPDFIRYPGVGYHQKLKPGTLTGVARRAARQKAGEFAARIWKSGERVVIENPRGGLSGFITDGDLQEIQPYQFGEDASKATCLRLKGVPRLIPTKYFPPRIVNGRPYWSNQTGSGQNRLGPAGDRWKLRSTTYQGIADAMAEQWGNYERIQSRQTSWPFEPS